MAETRIKNQDEYKGVYPTVFKKIDTSDISINPFQAFKTWSVISGSSTGSVLPLVGIYSDVNNLPALGTNLTYNDATNVDGTLQTLTYFSINHLFYKNKKEPSKTYGPTNLNLTKKFLFQSASILSFPQVKVGEGIKPRSFTLTGSGLYFASDRYGNVYDTSYNTSSFVTGYKYYEGFNEYFDTTRIQYESVGVTYEPGVNTSNGLQSAIGYAAKFSGAGYIRDSLSGYYDRDHDYAISFFITSSNVGTSDELILAKASSSLQPSYPFKVELSGSKQIVFTIAGSTEFKAQLTSSLAVSSSWTHVVCQKSGSWMQMYIDGTLHASASNDLLINTFSPFTASARIDNTSDLYIGGFNSQSSNVNAYLDEVRIFNKSLTGANISSLNSRTEGGTLLQTNVVGTVFDKQGIVVISSPDYRYHNLINAPFSASYKSTVTIHEMNVITRMDSGDFNMSTNLTLTRDDDSTYLPFVSGSSFAPYITTIGLYDEAGQLLAIGKLAQPIRKRNDVDMNFMIRIDLDKNISAKE